MFLYVFLLYYNTYKNILGVKAMDKDKKIFRTSFQFNYELYERFKKHCKDERISQVGLIERLIKQFLEDKKNENR